MSLAGTPRRVVIIGGGFGGVAAAKALRRSDVHVTVVDCVNHQLFQPLLYQVATAGIAAADAATPIRKLIGDHARVLMAEVTAIDPERNEIVLDRGERLGYDSLIVACGTQTTYFGHDEWRDRTFPLKTLADAIALRDRVYGAFEEAERSDDADTQAEWLTFAVVGGGPTGVEIAGQLAIIARHTMGHEFTRIRPSDARVMLLDAGERLVPAFGTRLSAKVARELEELGVTVRTGAAASAIDERGLQLGRGDDIERIAARTVIWSAGVRARPLVRHLAQATGATTDHGGRVHVDATLALPGHPEIAVIGDAACVAGRDGRPLPGLATTAIQQGRHVAKAIAAGEAGATTPFRYRDKGALAVVGRGRAVCSIRGHDLSGPPAFLIYASVHLYYLAGVGGRRLRVLGDWLSMGTTANRPSRVVEDPLPRR